MDIRYDEIQAWGNRNRVDCNDDFFFSSNRKFPVIEETFDYL